MCRKLLKIKRIGVLAIALVLLMAAGVAGESQTDAGGLWRYALEDGGAAITGYVGEPPEDLVFPSELDGHPVTRIGRWASDDVCLTSVTIPDSVTSIGDSAFYYCSLTTVTIPAGVTGIGRNPFEGCPMTHIDVAADNPVYEQVDGVLFDKQRKTLVAYPHAREENTYTIPEGVLRIGESAFSNNGNLTGVIIPNSVTSIGDMAFWGCVNLTSVTIPDSVTHIGDMAFKECDNLSVVTVPDSVISIGEEAFGWDSEVTLRTTGGSYAVRYAIENRISFTFAYARGERTDAGGQWMYTLEDGGATITGCVGVGSGELVIPSEIDGYQVKAIGEYAFEKSESLTGVTIPDSVTSIGEGAFLSCTGLTGITIPDSIVSIGEEAFFNCVELTSVFIPASVTNIGHDAFRWCDGQTLSVTVGSYAARYAEENEIPYAFMPAEGADATGELAGAWQTAEDDGHFVTLLLYPADAFRLYRYHEEDDLIVMLEGVREVEGDAIIVSDVRLGILDADGVYTLIEERDALRFTFSLDLGGAPALTLINEEGDAITLYPADLDSPE